MVQIIFVITRSKESINDSINQLERKTILLYHSFAWGCTLFVWRQRTSETMPYAPLIKASKLVR